MNKIGSVVFCFLIVSSMLIFPIQSDASQQDEIIYVDDDNTDGPWEGSFEHPFQYIQEGINASMDGDTVFVFDGNYQENLLISVSIVLQGNNKSTTIIDGNSKNNSAITIICDFVYITGFTISNGPIGIDLKGSCKTTIFNNLIQNNNLYGLRLNHFSNYNIIENNIIHNNSWAGINFHDSSDNLVIDNNINDNDDQGIIIFSSRDNRIIHNSIRDNVIGISLENDVCNISIIDNEFYRNGIKTRNSLSDCLLHTVVNNTINEKPLVYLQKKSNLVINNAGQVLLIDCNNVSIQNLDIISLNIGIFLLESSNCSITNNNISQCKYGMYIFYGNNNTISHNIIQNNTNDGILIHMSNSNFIINNKIFTNSVSGIRLFDFSKNNKIIGNTITNNKNGLWLSFFADYNSFLNNTISSGNCGILIYDFPHTIDEIKIVSNPQGIPSYCSYNEFRGNNVLNNEYGFYVRNAKHTSIVGNNIKGNNKFGIWVSSRVHNIENNNFIDNREGHAFFSTVFLASFFQSWNNNYWDDWHKPLPRPIFGKLLFFVINIPWFEFDWHPAQNPYDISGGGMNK